MASPKRPSSFGNDPLNLLIYALMFYSLLFFLLSYLMPTSRHWLGLPQLYFLLVSWLIMRRCKISFADLGFRRRELGKGVVIGLLVSLVPLAVVARFGWSVGWEHFFSVSTKIVRPTFFYQLFVLVILAPFSEELFFRGLLTRSMVGRLPTFLIVIIGALLFTAAHFTWQPGPLLLGVTTGTLFILYRSVVPGLVLHALCNFLGPVLILWAPRVYQELRVFFL